MLIRMGFFENFNGSDVILLDGGPAAFRSLATFLKELENPGAVSLHIHALPFVEPSGGTQLVAYAVSQELGVRRTNAERPEFSWQLSREGWLEAAEKIERLAGSGHGHQYLSAMTSEDAIVFVSIDEYGDSWWSAL